MTIQPEVAIPEVVVQLAGAVGHAQRQINEEWLERLDEYLPILQFLRKAGFEDLGRVLTPAQLIVSSTTINVGMFVRQESPGRLAARLFSLGMLHRQSSVRSVNIRIDCEIRQVPVVPTPLAQELENAR